MSHNQAINLYSQLFNRQITKNYEYFKSIYTTPVHVNALLSVLGANSESLGGSNSKNDSIVVLRSMFVDGITLLSQTTGYLGQGREKDSEDTNREKGPVNVSNRDSESISSINSHRSNVILEFDDGGEDITSLSGKVSSGSSYHIFTGFDDGDDITTLNGNKSSGNSNLEVGAPVSRAVPSSSASQSKEFEGIDDELKAQLVCNILQIFQVWFKNIYHTNKKLLSSENSLRITSSIDLTTKLFSLPGTEEELNDDLLFNLLAQLKWYLDNSISLIEGSELTQFPYLSVLKEIIFLLVDILKNLFLSISLHDNSSNEHVIIKSLLFTFFKANFSEGLDKILAITNAKFDEVSQEYRAPKVRLSAETLMKVYIILGTLSNLPISFLPVNTTLWSLDITNLNNESPNVYENYFKKFKHYDSISFNQEINSRILPFFAIDFNYYYNFKPDLLIYQIKNSSFMNWLTGNRFNDNLYIKYNTVGYITDINKNYETLSLTKDIEDPYLKEMQHIYDIRIKKLNQIKEEDNIETYDLLPILLLLYSYCKNSSFLKYFTSQLNKVSHKIEDFTPEEDKVIELFEIWLCLLSYNFQYQYKSDNLQSITKISLSILVKLTSKNSVVKDSNISLIDNIKNYQINEFKWKLSHQKLPIVPNNLGKEGFKSSLFYILDVLQILIRFNLTKKLNVQNFRLALNIIYQILVEFYKDEKLGIGSYSWIEFYKTIFNLLIFIRKQNLSKSKYLMDLNQIESLKSLVEEIFIILNFLLNKKFDKIIQFSNNGNSPTGPGYHQFKPITYELVYNILLNYEMIDHLLNEFELRGLSHLSNLNECLEHLKNQFHFTEEDNTQISNSLDLLHLDFDSPIFFQKLSDYNSGNENETVMDYDSNETHFKYEDTFKYIDKNYDASLIDELEICKVFNVLFSTIA